MQKEDYLADYYKLLYDSSIEMRIPMILGEYQIDKLIYETANSVVVSAHTNTEKFAIKFIPIDNVVNARKESLIMSGKRHKHIIKFIDSFESDTFFAIVMSISETDLTQYINEHNYLPEEKAKKVMADAFDAIIFLHKDGIWHRDIKSDNIFVMKDTSKGPEIVIGDFGLACSTEFEKIEGKPVGSLNYAAPELICLDFSQCYECDFLEEASYTNSIDSWCLGEVMYFILCGIHPFQLGDSDGERHVDGNVTFDIPEDRLINFGGVNPFDNVSEEAKDLIRSLICFDPDERCSVRNARKHPWFNDFVDQCEEIDADEEIFNEDENLY